MNIVLIDRKLIQQNIYNCIFCQSQNKIKISPWIRLKCDILIEYVFAFFKIEANWMALIKGHAVSTKFLDYSNNAYWDFIVQCTLTGRIIAMVI